MSTLLTARRRAEMIRADVKQDAAELDGTPFTGDGVAPVLGTLFAICGALAACVEELCDAVETLTREAGR